MISHNSKMSKGIPIAGHEDPQGMWLQAMPLERDRVPIPMLGCLYPQYRRLSGANGQFEHEGEKKNLNLSTSWNQPRMSSPWPNFFLKHLAHSHNTSHFYAFLQYG